jgi:hypothetical protein
MKLLFVTINIFLITLSLNYNFCCCCCIDFHLFLFYDNRWNSPLIGYWFFLHFQQIFETKIKKNSLLYYSDLINEIQYLIDNSRKKIFLFFYELCKWMCFHLSVFLKIIFALINGTNFENKMSDGIMFFFWNGNLS